MEQKLKQLIGEQVFAIAALQVQLDAMTAERDALKEALRAASRWNKEANEPTQSDDAP